MRYKQIFPYFFLAGCLLLATVSYGQINDLAPKTTTRTAEDSLVTIEILTGRKLEVRKINDSTQLQILAGNVRLKQGSTLFDCDSCVINNNTNIFEAWGHVHINDSDTANIYSNHLIYLIKKKVAYLDGAVRLTDGKGELTTPDMEYDVDTKIGIYQHGGKVINKKSVLTSKEGFYYTDLKDVYFKKDVDLRDPAYTIKTDSLLYNTESGTVRFIAETFIRDSSGRTIQTKEGFYNLQTGKAEFGQRPTIKDGSTTIRANRIAIDDSTGVAQAEGNAIIIDSTNQTTILAGSIFRNKKTEAILATLKPVMIIKQDNDSIFITADTLFSARLTDLPVRKTDSVQDTLTVSRDSVNVDSTGRIVNRDSTIARDTITNFDSINVKKVAVPQQKDTLVSQSLNSTEAVAMNEKDSTNRYFEAYRHVRIFSDSMQAVSDSLFYSFKDSVFRLFQDPVVWANESQITGDTILLFTKNKQADRVKVFTHSFLINQLDPEVFNQIKSSRMDGFFKEGSIDSVRCSGLAECIYYIQDEDSAYTGVNESKSDILDIYFANKELNKVVFRSMVTGTVWPMRQKDPKEMRLPGFIWQESRRPKTKFELFE